MIDEYLKLLDSSLFMDAAEIFPAIMDYEHGWNTADAEHMFRTAAEDLTQVNIVGMFWHGRPAVIKAHALLFEGTLKDVLLKLIGIEHLRPVGIDGLSAVVRWRVGAFSLRSAVKPAADNLMTMVFAASSDVWRLVHVANIEVVNALARENPIS